MKIPILTYHSILPRDEISAIASKKDKIYCLEKSLFEEQMGYLTDNGFTPISFNDFRGILRGNCKAPEKPIILTFDDGREDNYRIALRILKKFGIKATFFIVTNWIGKEGYLKWDQVKEMLNQGMQIQSHTHTHSVLDGLSDRRLKQELSMSKEIIESNLQSEVFTLALPHGAKSESLEQAARDIGYRLVCTSEWGLNRLDKNMFFLKRLPLKNGNAMSRFIAFAEARELHLIPHRTQKLLVNAAKKMLGKPRYDLLRNFILR